MLDLNVDMNSMFNFMLFWYTPQINLISVLLVYVRQYLVNKAPSHERVPHCGCQNVPLFECFKILASKVQHVTDIDDHLILLRNIVRDIIRRNKVILHFDV